MRLTRSWLCTACGRPATRMGCDIAVHSSEFWRASALLCLEPSTAACIERIEHRDEERAAEAQAAEDGYR